jgi:predicted peptidase
MGSFHRASALRAYWRIALLLLSSLGFAGCANQPPAKTFGEPGMREIEFQVDGRPRRAGLFVPDRVVPPSGLPLVIYLHGKGERGDGLEHLAHGLGKAIRRDPARFAGFVLLPQCPADRLWVAVDQPWAVGLPGGEAHIDAALAWALANLPIDRSRITLTGLSMGGFGTLMYGARHADTFAALAAMCGGGRAADAAVLASRPVWLVHGDADMAVKIEESRKIAAAVRAVRADAPLRLTEYPGVAHNCWDRAYADPELIEFLFRPGFR